MITFWWPFNRLIVPVALALAASGCGSESFDGRSGGAGGPGAGGGVGSGAGGGPSGSGGSPLADAHDPGPADASVGVPTDAPVRIGDAIAQDVRPPPGPVIVGCDGATANARADQTLAEMMFAFWNGTTQYLDATEPSDGRMTGYWTFAQAFDAVLDGVERTSGQHYKGLIKTLYTAENARTWTSDYYDDEDWMTLALIRAFDMTGDKTYLDRAVTIYLDITAAWDDTSAFPGGIWWNRAHTQKATAANAGPVIAGARLSARTGDGAHLAFARKVYDFWYTKMVTANRVADHITPDGVVHPGRLTYNEGLMTGAGLALYAATGEVQFRTQAHGIAHTLVTETKTTSAGPVLADGTNTSCTGDCPQWKGIGYRYLAAALRDDPARSEYEAVLRTSVTGAWTLARNPTTGLFANDWAGPTMPTAQIEAESSTVMALNLYAMVCGAYVAPPATGYEAEDAVLNHVALEGTNAGFSGWGYVSGWTANGQSVEFAVQPPSAGGYRIDIYYAAGAADAVRALSVNGIVTTPRLAFPSTGAWTTWGHVSTTVQLTTDVNAIRLAYDSANASASQLNLDRLTVNPP